MAELYEKELARVGRWQSAQGEVNVTPERIDHWYRAFKSLRAQGYKFPTPWGHKLEAGPVDAADPYGMDEVYARSNAGYMVDLRKSADGTRLFMTGTVPPGHTVGPDEQLENAREGTVIAEVSPGVGDWRDGQGRYHRDIIVHAALCTHPVQHGQAGFRPLPGRAPDPAQDAPLRFLSAAGQILRLHTLAIPKGPPMPFEKKKADGDADADIPEIPAPEPAGDEPAAAEAGPAGDGPILPETEPTPEQIAPEPDPAGLGMMGFTPTQVEQMKQVMGQLGAPLLPDTTQSNIIDRLITLLTMAAGQGASLSPQAQDAQAQPLDLSTDGGAPDPNQNATGGGAGGMGAQFMSTRTGKVIQLDASGRALAERAGAKERDLIGREWDRIAKGGSAQLRAFCEERKADATRFHMSLNPETGQVSVARARDELKLVKRALASVGHYKILGFLATGARPQANPAAGHPTPPPAAQRGQATDDDIRAEVARQTGCAPDQVVIRRGTAPA